MKKLLNIVLAVAVLVSFSELDSANASEKYVAGGFEASGHVVSGFGYQHQQSNPQPATQLNSEGASGFGVLGRYANTAAVAASNQDDFRFFVDEVELDLAKSWGENISIRADLEFSPASGAYGGATAVRTEQAYVTTNLAVGNGVEVLFGRFNAPNGFESIDVVDNSTISQSAIIRGGLRPVSLTGAKLYYAFSDMVDWHFWLSNNATTGGVKAVTDTPSAGWRLGFNWGDEGNESTLGVSAFAGAEQGTKSDFTFGTDIDLNWWLTDSFAVGAELLFRRDNGVAGGVDAETLAGLLNLHYMFSDVWDGTLKYAYTKDFDNATTPYTLLGFEGSAHEISLAGGYAIADDAKLMLEGRFDALKTGAGANVKSYDYGAAVGFAYNF